VEASFLTAIDVARRQDARLLVLRAALSLALVWRRTRRGAEARRHVAAARADLIEDVGLPDVIEASAFLTDNVG
jgi:hypothetical protein